MEYPKLRHIEAFPVETSGKQVICLRDPFNFTDNTLLVPYNVFYIISHFDGNHSILDIQSKYTQQYGDLLFSNNLQEIIRELDKNLFLENNKSRDYINKIIKDFKNSTIRKAMHAGKAYEQDRDSLRNQINEFFTSKDGPGRLPLPINSGKLKADTLNKGILKAEALNKGTLKAIIAPHIDIRSGGPCFAWAYKELAEASNADTFIIFGIVHSGARNLFALTNKDFETPFGTVETDRDFIETLSKKCKFDYFEDEYAHRNEHTIEFQLIFLQHLYHQKKDFKIVPVLCSSFVSMDGPENHPHQIPFFEDFVSSLKETIEISKKKTCLIASVDLAHVGQRFGDKEVQDDAYLKRLENDDIDMLKFAERLDAEGFYNSIKKDNDKRKICGFPAIYTMLNITNASKGKLLNYSQSADPNTQSTVTFASMAFY